MSRSRTLKLAVAFLASASVTGRAVGFGPGEAAARFLPDRAARQAAGDADFKVLFWYRRTDPLGTFRYQIYDLRKGEYTAAVETWIKNLETKYSAFTAIVRDVALRREKGETEMLKVGAVIKRELLVVTALSGVDIGGASYSSRARPILPQSAPQGTFPRSNLPSVDRSFLNPSPIPFPVPLPYPRPHP
jgi:hypothetical protein